MGNSKLKDAGKVGGQNRVDLSDDQVRQVGEMAKLGLRMEDIAKVLGIGEATVKRIAARDPRVTDTLKKAREDLDRQVMETAFRMATDGKSPAMTIFWMKARMGWKESQRIEHTGKDGSPIATKSTHDWVGQLSTEKLKNLQKMKEQAEKEAQAKAEGASDEG